MKQNQQHREQRPSEFETKLPAEIHCHIFSFFKIKELANIAATSHYFNCLTHCEIERLKSTYPTKFYTVGEPIHCILHSMVTNKPAISYRNDVTHDEIKRSFTKQQEFKLFFNEDDALAYSRSLRQGELWTDDKICQPAIMELHLLAHYNPQDIHREIIVINKAHQQSQPHTYDWRYREHEIIYIKAQRAQILALKAYLKVQRINHGDFTYYGPVHYHAIDHGEEPVSANKSKRMRKSRGCELA
jgi:hypothetical protein